MTFVYGKKIEPSSSIKYPLAEILFKKPLRFTIPETFPSTSFTLSFPSLDKKERSNFLKFKEITFTEMMNFYFNIYDDLTN